MKRAFGKTPAVAAALILTMIPVLAGCRDDGDPAARPEAALTEAADPGIEAADLAAGETVAEDEPAEAERRAFISAGSYRTAVIAADGSLWATGVLGNAWDTPSIDRFVRIGDEYDWALVSHGLIALRTDGSIWELRRGSLEQIPATVGHVWIHADGGFAVREDGSLWQWGHATGNAFSDLVRVGTRTDWVRVHHGAWGAFAIDEAGALWAWGSNHFGQLGVGTQGWDGRYSDQEEIPSMIFSVAEPTRVEGGADRWVSVSTILMYRHHVSTVAVGADGSLWRWGSNFWGAHNISPARVGTEYGWATVSSGSAFWGSPRTVMTKTDGSLWELGAHDIPVRVGSGNDWVAAVAGGGEHGTHAIALKADGTFWAWGNNAVGQFRNVTSESSDAPVRIMEGGDFSAERARIEAKIAEEYANRKRWAAVSAGNLRTAAITTDGSLWAWGRLDDNGRTSIHTRPVRVGEEYDWAFVSNGLIALRADGSMWGLDAPSVPVQSATGHVWIHADGTPSNGLAVRADGALWQWGHGTGGTFPDPVRVGARSDWAGVHQGANGAFAIDEDGGLWAWGSNQFGQLGIGAQGWDGSYGGGESPPWMIFNAAEPTRVEGGADGWVSVSTRTSDRFYVSTVAVGADGSLWRWGSDGQPGVGNLSPVRVGTGYGWATVASGSASRGSPRTILTKTDGSLWEMDGQYLPVRVGSDYDWIAAAASGGERETHAVALKADGSLWAWGNNVMGQFGDGTRVSSDVPVQIISGGDE